MLTVAYVYINILTLIHASFGHFMDISNDIISAERDDVM